MDVLLLGTGGADGWPNPFCTCASCCSQRAAGEVRGQTAALVDEVLLLDAGPEAARAAERAGRDLAGVRHVLVTHPDHAHPDLVRWRPRSAEPLDLVGPAGALARYDDRLAPDDPVRRRPVRPGDTLGLGGYRVRVLAAAPCDAEAVLYDVTGPDGSRLLYAPVTGPLPEETLTRVAGAAYHLVLLEETHGDRPDAAPRHLDLVTFGRQVAELRRRGAVVEGTDVVAVHLGHGNPPAPELARRLAAYGARVVPDGTLLTVGAPPPRRPRRVLVLGGARSGKSAEAERRLLAEPAVTYVATGGTRPGDPEWAARVAAHRARRPPSWRTVETTDLVGVLRTAATPVLIDCLSLWLTAVMDEEDAWDDTAWRDGAQERLAARVEELVAAWRSVRVPVIAVSNEVGSGVVPPTTAGRRFRDELGRLNTRIAAESEEVVLVVAGQVLSLRRPQG
ncbi:bifunctional adenosylcobinamide kinase/adenosylcobinamide-phosphate guanylyltransferase [Carbonactinospora thermoautotrophica]|uniref:bifunctional adenosylcobinamide kinase/adenosylcobinamide-phosphate guanylyltransferase n=1 Tax=Carbonactinospora thermoautotrophica TaxID=1469144 RepID=UPI00226F24E2|nr:bifunctional adenosylcobinamide kinase/adenosylcobinamide-phosphate guanylyltransferase [Carbonactinospora thermoautotrophica]MCX9190868.1 bifunctional adenosylcobinamide kinase/adenosylcobinamide-phosphate guanylyltransferase [Carbonactinospora thermoautotrophica]